MVASDGFAGFLREQLAPLGRVTMRMFGKTGVFCNAREGVRLIGMWLTFLDTYRSLCVAPPPDFRRLLEEIRKVPLAA